MNIESEHPPYFVFPTARTYTDAAHVYRGTHATYAQYNYLRPGLVSRLKRQRFEIALRMAALWFHRTPVVDFGCGDGVFLPSLARYFPAVVGIDRDAQACAIAREMIDELSFTNVHVLASTNLIAPADYHLAFVMETIEHACSPDAARIVLLEDLLRSLAPDAQLILSVPRTTGPLFLAKYLAQRLNGITDDALTLTEALRAGLFSDTRSLEPRWHGTHLGFNDSTFTKALFGHFDVLEQQHTVLSNVYRITLSEMFT